MHSGVLRVARGGSGTKAPPLAARPKSVSGEDCRDLTRINRQRKRAGCNRSLPKATVSKLSKKGCAAVSRRKERASRKYDVALPVGRRDNGPGTAVGR